MKKSENPKKTRKPEQTVHPHAWKYAAALGLLMLLAAVLLCVRFCGAEENDEFLLPPMIYADGQRYIYEADADLLLTAEDENDLVFAGNVTDVVEQSVYVTKHLQANTPIAGASLYRWGEYLVCVTEEGRDLYRPMAEVGRFTEIE